MPNPVLEQRAERLVSPELGIAEPASYISYEPFDDPKYSHRDKLLFGSLQWEELVRRASKDPKAFLSPDPYAKSKFREKGFAVWDSAALPQTAAAEKYGTLFDSDVERLTFRNPHPQYVSSKFDALVGTNLHGQPVRPTGRYIFDLTRMNNGWLLLEAAHALAHLRCDALHGIDLFRPWIQKTMCRALASLLQGLLFDCPVYIGPKNADGNPLVWPYADIAVANVRSPVLQVRKTGSWSMAPDEVCTECLWLQHVEPVPESYVAKTVNAGSNDEWSGLPTLMAFAGWDGVDSVLHARTKYVRNVEYHVLHAGDLIDPALYGQAIELCKDPPPDNGEWVSVKSWLGSESWAKLVSCTPPIPCDDCYIVNERTDGAPRMPKSDNPMSWKLYDGNRNECISIAAKAADKAEVLYYTQNNLVRTPRKLRRRNHAKALKDREHARVVAERIERIKAKVAGKVKTPLTEKERELYAQMKKDAK